MEEVEVEGNEEEGELYDQEEMWVIEGGLLGGGEMGKRSSFDSYVHSSFPFAGRVYKKR